ncbi:MAG: general secretion pathway protein GspC [Myxococcaceae bacterium]|nr:general secretion pathway protein GspC [Myxococcaceae bacterium]
MELLFRKYFWVVNLVFIALVAFIVARTVNQFVEWKISAIPVHEVQHVARPKAPEQHASLDLERLAGLTGLKVPEPEPVVQEPTEPVVDMNAAPVKSSLRVKLLGTLLASSPEWSIASIQDVVTNVSNTYMVNDTIQGAKVLEIERKRVIVLNNGHREYIDDQPGDGMGAIAAVPSPVTSPAIAAAPVNRERPDNHLGEGIRAISENEYEVPRSEIDKTLANLNDVAMQARIVPAFKDGVAHGFKLFSIRPDSIYTKIGIQNGDVIKRINGYDLNSPEKALEIYSKLKEATRVDIEIERNGSTIRKTYSVR